MYKGYVYGEFKTGIEMVKIGLRVTMRNLLEETMKCLRKHGKAVKDIVWIGSYTHRISWSQFRAIAKSADYDCTFGAQEVADNLLIVGDAWWMERGEYDGQEWWEFKQIPKMPKDTLKITALTVRQADDCSVGWESLEELNPVETEWRPRWGDGYFSVEDGQVCCWYYHDGDSRDEKNINEGNYFRTEEEAQEELDRQRN